MSFVTTERFYFDGMILDNFYVPDGQAGLSIKGFITQIKFTPIKMEYVEVQEMGQRNPLRIPSGIGEGQGFYITIEDVQYWTKVIDKDTIEPIVQVGSNLFIVCPKLLCHPDVSFEKYSGTTMELHLNIKGPPYKSYEEAATTIMKQQIEESNEITS